MGVIAVVVVWLTASLSVATQAYNLAGWQLSYKSAPYKWGDYLQTSGSTIRDAWEDAITDWDEACSAHFYHSDFAISELNSMHDDDDDLLGWTDVYAPNGTVNYFYAYLNAWSSYIFQTNVARSSANHELGHVLGLDEMTSGIAIMNLNRNRATIYTPKTDDINGIRAIYGE